MVIGIVYAAVASTWLTLAITNLLLSFEEILLLSENWQAVPVRLLSSLAWSILGAGIAIPFGFIGAAIALSLTLLPFASRRSQRVTIVLGGLAGLMHSAVGWGLRIADQQMGYGHPWEQYLTSVGMWGGFLLTNTHRLATAYAAVPASIIAGCAAGMIFFHVSQRQPRSKSDGFLG